MFAGTMDYTHHDRRADLLGTASTAFRYDGRSNQVVPVSHRGEAGATVHLPNKASLKATQTAAYSPSYFYEFFPTGSPGAPAEPLPDEPNYRTDASDSYSYVTNAEVAFGSARGTRLAITGEYDRTDYARETIGLHDLEVYTTGAEVSRAFSRNGSLSARYEYRAGDYQLGSTREQSVMFGLDYSRSLSRSRRATFSVKLGPARMEAPTSDASQLTAPHYGLQGEASIDYPFRLNWRVFGNYSRDVQYQPTFTRPVFSDGVHAGLTGIVKRRLDLSTTVGYATGTSGTPDTGKPLETYTGDINVRYALQRSLALYTAYMYYYYDLSGQVGLAPGLPPVFEASAVHVGFTLFIEH
jgi:hypothetical protein